MQTPRKEKPLFSRKYPSMRDEIAEFCSIILTLSVTAVLVALTFLIPVDTEIKKHPDKTLLARIIENSKPEPLEMIQYTMAISLIAVLFFVFYNTFAKRAKRLSVTAGNIMTLGFTAATGVASVIAYVLSYRNYDYFDEMFYPTLFIAPLIAAGILFLCFKASDSDKAIKGKVIFFSVIGVIIAYSIYRILAFDFSLQVSEFNVHHYYACWYPIAKVDAGQTIGVDFRSIYGFYPYLVVPVLKLLGGVNQRSSTILLTILLVVIALSYSLFCYKFIKNKFLSCVTAALSCLYGPFSILGDRSIGGVKMYLQFNPLRTFFPAIVLIAIVLRSNVKSRRVALIYNIVMCLVGGLAIFWNFEMGLVSALIWAAYNVYSKAVKKSLISRDTLRTVLTQTAFMIGSIIIFFILVLSVTYFRSGRILTFHELFFGLFAFAGTGFNLMPVSYRLWVVLIIVFTGAFLTVAPYLTKHKNASEDELGYLNALFAMGVTGIGTLIYFVGRSDITITLMYLPYGAICCGVLCEFYLIRFKKDRLSGVNTGVILGYARMYFCCVLIASLVLPSLNNLITSFDARYPIYHNADRNNRSIVQKQTDFIKEWADNNNGGEYPNILTTYAIFIDEQLGIKPTFKVCEEMDWYFREDSQTYIDFLNEHPDECFVISNSALAYLNEDYREEWKKVLSQFELSAEDEDIFVHIYVPKSNKTGS